MADKSSHLQIDVAKEAAELRLRETGFSPTLPAVTPNPALAATLRGPVTPQPAGDGGAASADLALLAVPGTIPEPLKNWERYEIVRPLGQGGMGTVFLARDARLGRLVALKFLRLPSPDATERMLQEARAQARLDHPSICKVFEVGEFSGQPYIAMEYIDGQPLQTALRRLTLEQKVMLLQQTALAVHAAHSQGILHRDLKPANIMICSPPAEASSEGPGGLRPVLMDFGLARDSLGPQRLTQTGVIMGTPHYMAPEQARGQARHLDRRADVYSLGAILYELLTGRPPFDAEHEVDLLLAVLQQDPPPPRQIESSVPVDLEVIALKCLRKEPEHRYDSALALAEDLLRYLRSEPILARPASTLYRIRRLAMRHRALFAVAAVLMLALCGIIGISWRARQKELRASLRADERQRLAAELGQTITKLNLFLRVAYSLPPHSIDHEQELVRQYLRNLQAQRAGADPFLHPTLERAIGQGYLTLGEYEPAVEHLLLAKKLGERSPGMHLTLGQALGRLYEQRVSALNRVTDAEQAKPELSRLRQELLLPARQELQAEPSSELTSPAYIRALLHFYSDDSSAEYAAALTEAQKAQSEAPWLLEPIELELKITLLRYIEDVRHGKPPSAAESQAVHDAIERAVSIARSYPDFYADFIDYKIMYARGLQLSSSKEADIDGLFKEAIPYARTALLLQPQSGVAHDQLAEIYAGWAFSQVWQQQNPMATFKAGLAATQAAMEISPPRGRTYLARSRLYLVEMTYRMSQGLDAQADGEKSLADARRAAQFEPTSSDIRNVIVVSLSGIVEIKRAKGITTDAESAELIAAGKRAVELRPDLPLPVNNLAAMYLASAQDAIEHGRDPESPLSQARRLVEKLNTEHVDYLLGQVVAFDLERIELKAQLVAGQDVTVQAQKALAKSRAALNQHPEYAFLQEQVAENYYFLIDALLRHPGSVAPGPIFDEALAVLVGLEQHGLGAAMGELMRFRLLLRKAEWRKGLRQSPEPALSEVFRGLDIQQGSGGGQQSELFKLRGNALRLRAEWLLNNRQTAAALAATNAGLAVCDEAEKSGAAAGYLVKPERGALLTLWAQLTSDPRRRADTAVKASAILTEVLKTRPPLSHEFGGYLKTAQALAEKP